MFKEAGLYVFPNGNLLKQFSYDGSVIKEYPSMTCAEQLIDFLEINLITYTSVINRLKESSFYKNEIFDIQEASSIMMTVGVVASEFCKGYPYAVLLVSEMMNRDDKSLYWSAEDFEYKRNQQIEVLENLILAQSMFDQMMYEYCIYEGTHEEKLRHVIKEEPRCFDITFREVICTANLGENMFTSTEYCVPIRKGYYFDTLLKYLYFLFINTLMTDINFSVCKYCGHFFIPKTKKKTHYCNRVRTADGRTCQEIGPPFLHKLRASKSIVLTEYNKAKNRNFKRVQRFEELLSDNKVNAGDGLDYEKYSYWIQHVQEKLTLWRENKLTDDEILTVVHELD